jgi:hypothetical protein
LLLLIPHFARAEGRLFYSPSERTALEHARQHHITERDTTPPRPGNRPLTFNGVVLRSDGRNTGWINDRPVSGFARTPTFKGQPLKPGEAVVNGKVYEPHQIIRETDP